MGKTKQLQRTKGNFQPSSSAKAAELVTKTGGTLPGQFFNLSKFLKPQEEPDTPYDTDFCYVLKKISKKDFNTKRKGLQEFGQLCLEKDVEAVAAVLTYWIPHYTKLSQDNDRRVRESCQECFLNISGRVKNKLAPHLKDLMGTWLMAQCDGHLPSATLARRAFETLFKESKQAEAVWFCRGEIIKQLTDTMFETNIQSIKDSDVCEADEIEGRLARLQTSALDAMSRFVKLSDPQYSSQIHETLEMLLNNKEFWKFHKHATPSIRRAFYDLLSDLCDRGTFGEESPYREQASRTVLLCVDESNPHVVAALWRAVVSLFNVKNCWSFVNMNKAFLPKLFTMLDNGGYGCSEMIYPNLVVVLDNLPNEVKADEKFYFRFLSRFRNGLSQNNVLANYRECDAVAKSFVECCKFVAYGFVESGNVASASVVVKDHIVTLLVSVLKDVKSTLTCSFKYIAEIMWYIHKMSVKTSKDCGDDDDQGDKKRHAWMQVFESAFEELAEISKNLISGEVEDEPICRLTLFYQSFLSFQNESTNQKSRQRKIVTFELTAVSKPVGSDVKDSTVKSKLEIMEAYKLNESLKKFVHGLSSALFSEIKLEGQWLNRMKLFRMLFERFACEEFLQVLKPSSEQGSTTHSFLKDVVCSWMTLAEPTLFSEVTNIFLVALSLETEGERMVDFELALSELEEAKDPIARSKLYNYLSLLFESSDDHLIELWTRSEKCRKLIVASAAECVKDFLNHVDGEEAWNMIGILLSRNDDNGSVLDAKFKVLSSIKEHLLINDSFVEKKEETFSLIEMLFSHLNETNSVNSLTSCEAFDWLLNMLLWSAVNPYVTSVGSTSRKTLISTLEILSIEGSDIKDSQLHRVVKLLLKYVNNHVSQFTNVEEVLETSKELIRLMYNHSQNFNFFTDFVTVPSLKVYDVEQSEDRELHESSWLQTLCQMDSENNSQSRDSIIFTQLFYAKLFTSLASSTSKEEEPVKESDDVELESSFTNDEDVVFQDLSSLVLGDDDDPHVISFINNTLDCIACLTFSDVKCTKTIRDGIASLDILIPRLGERSNFDLVRTRVESCYESQNEFTLDINSLALVMLLKKIGSTENSSLLSEESDICEKLLAVTDVNTNVTKVVMAMICFAPETVVEKLFDKFYELVASHPIEKEEDLTETLMNSFAILNAIFKTSDGRYLSFETNSESAAETTDNLKSIDALFDKINEAKQFCEGFFTEDGKFDVKIGRTNTMVINFYKNVIQKFLTYPGLAEKYWDEILCFTVTRFEDLGTFCSSPEFEFSSEFETFVLSVVSIVLEMSRLFNSKEFLEVLPRLADEWVNVFQPSFYEYLNLFFINEAQSKVIEHLDVLELLCNVVSRSPSDNLDFHKIKSSPGDDETEASFQLLLPLVQSPHRCVQVCGYSLLKKFIPRKIEHLVSKYGEDSMDGSFTESTSEESESKPVHPSAFLPSLIEQFETISKKLKSADNSPSNVFKENDSNRFEDLYSYLLAFDLIAETFKSSPPVVKSSISDWLLDDGIGSHMTLLTSAMSRNPSEHLQQTAFEDIRLQVSFDRDFLPASQEMFYSCLGCEGLKEGVVVPRLKVKDHEDVKEVMHRSIAQDVEQLSFRVFARTVRTFSRVVRSWFSNLDQRSAAQVDKFVTRFISPCYVSKELSEVQQAVGNQTSLNFQVKTYGKELSAVYSADDASVTFNVTFPENSPLSNLKVNLDHNRIISVKQLSNVWMLQLTKLLNFKDGTLMDALVTMSKNLDQHFNGNSCMICFSLVLNHMGTKVLPKVQCKTCKKRFHNVCLFTWFKSSHNSNCPLCRSIF